MVWADNVFEASVNRKMPLCRPLISHNGHLVNIISSLLCISTFTTNFYVFGRFLLHKMLFSIIYHNIFLPHILLWQADPQFSFYYCSTSVSCKTFSFGVVFDLAACSCSFSNPNVAYICSCSKRPLIPLSDAENQTSLSLSVEEIIAKIRSNFISARNIGIGRYF